MDLFLPRTNPIKGRIGEILGIIESKMSVSELTKNIDMIDCLNRYGMIPIQELAEIKELRNENARYVEILGAIRASSRLKDHLVEIPRNSGVKAPILIHFTKLLINRIDLQPIDIEDMKKFITCVCGKEPVGIKKKGGQILVMFNTYDNCIAFWRALKYIHFHHVELTARIYSTPLSKFKNKSAMRQAKKPPAPKIKIERPRGGLTISTASPKVHPNGN